MEDVRLGNLTKVFNFGDYVRKLKFKSINIEK